MTRHGAWLALAAALALAAPRAAAQPAPSVSASCEGLRAALEGVEDSSVALVTIEVTAELTLVRSDDALAYLLACREPAPAVLCITYETNGRREGDRVLLTGSYYRVAPDRVLLDPCLASEPE
jgi:hypothetical protein